MTPRTETQARRLNRVEKRPATRGRILRGPSSACTIPDDRAAVREAKRVLRPGGKFLLAEHVRSPNLVVRTLQRMINPLSVRFGGDHPTREPLEDLRSEGFEIDEVRRSKLGLVELGSARKPLGVA